MHMQVKQIMTTNVATCQLNTNLAVVAKLMWDRDCSFVLGRAHVSIAIAKGPA